MANPLVTTVRKGGRNLFNIYIKWGAGCWGRVQAMCTVLSAAESDADLPSLLGKVSRAFGKGAGLLDHRSWFSAQKDFEAEWPAVSRMLDSGVPACTDKSVALIAFTPKAMESIEREACDCIQVDLDGENTVLDCLEPQGNVKDQGYELARCGYSGCEIEEELENINEAPHVHDWMKQNITKENAVDIMRRWDAESSEIWIDGDEVLRAYQEC